MSEIDVQIASGEEGIPPIKSLRAWAQSVLEYLNHDYSLVIRIVDDEEISQLNQHYRQRDGTTNVLSFPLEIPEHVPLRLLGDIVICAPVVLDEARHQNKAPEAHFAHMVVHGVLHLLGYDHIDEAYEMESLEVKILTKMGYPNPYNEVVVV